MPNVFLYSFLVGKKNLGKVKMTIKDEAEEKYSS